MSLTQSFKNPYTVGEKVQFFNRYGVWVNGVIVDFAITEYYFKAVIKCSEPDCKLHKVCVCSLYLRKIIRCYYSSLDLDWQFGHQQESLSCSEELADRILNKIVKCKYCVVASKNLSNYKGWHVEFYCTKKCDLCRLQFDDIRRYEEDLERLPQFQNLIFDIKHGY